jgi:hypothetical protein
MPWSQPAPLPGLATQIKNLTERVRALEAKRTFSAASVLPSDTFVTPDTSIYAPGDWNMTAMPGPAGFLVCFGQVTATTTSTTFVPANLFVDCNGSLVFIGTGNIASGSPVTTAGVAVFSGLTVNTSYTVQVYVSAGAVASVTWSAPQLVVLPF